MPLEEYTEVMLCFGDKTNADISDKREGDRRKLSGTGELVWCVGCFLHIQLPHELELSRYTLKVLKACFYNRKEPTFLESLN